ncbi:hypothetical protein [Haemophilus paracuniculus]|nr:hypothetical protein [Haemophilus paracuniculus]
MSGGPEAPLVFGDLKFDERVIYLEKPLNPISSLLDNFRKIHLATKINKKVELPLRGIWDKTLSLSTINFSKDVKYHIIFINTSIVKYNIEYLRNLKKQYNIDFYLYMLDSVNTYRGYEVRQYLFQYNILTRIYSFDNEDCKKYQFTYFVQPIAKQNLKNEGISENDYDLYFLGRSKGRGSELAKFYEKYHKQLKLNIKVLPDNQTEEDSFRKLGIYSDYIPYIENVSNILKSNVILELLQHKQSGNSLRYQEAIIYNKKLITTNKNIVNLPFFNEKNMVIIDNLDQIDLDWIQDKTIVDYCYNNEFSATKLIDHIAENV